MKRSDIWSSAVCPHCEHQLHVSDNRHYPLMCKDCDIYIYPSEIKTLRGDLFEISTYVPRDFDAKHKNDLKKLREGMKIDFMGFDDVDPDNLFGESDKVIMDIGWDASKYENKIPPTKVIQDTADRVVHMINAESEV